MERKDLELEQRVWQRVNGCKPGREEASLRELEQRCRESAQVFRQLAQGCSGPLREGLAELHRQEHANALTIRGIRASFVLYRKDDGVYMSARSLGEVNVQVILEPLGGGGNAATAGAQVRNKTVAEALDELVKSIDRFFEQ